MNEISMYEAYKKKLQGICDENNLVFRFRNDTYPITLTIKPCGGLENQISMLESAEEGYMSPDSYLMFIYQDGSVTYKTSERFQISDALFSKLKNLFKNMHYLWLQYLQRNLIERGLLNANTMPTIEESEDDDLPEEAEPLEEFEDDPLDEEDDPTDDFPQDDEPDDSPDDLDEF